MVRSPGRFVNVETLGAYSIIYSLSGPLGMAKNFKYREPRENKIGVA